MPGNRTAVPSPPSLRPLPVPPVPADLTQHEIQALRTRYNLADAHTHQGQSPAQQAIVARLPELFHASEHRPQAFFEERLTDAFFRLHRQPTAAALGRSLLSYSASVATMVAAMYLNRSGRSVSLVEPCFDNLTDLLRNMRVSPVALPESVLHRAEDVYGSLAAHVRTDAVYLVDPNNPTGFSLAAQGRRAFGELVRFCADHGKLLVLDFCFASFALCDEKVGRFDVYRILEDAGVSYMAIEDTGKTWPLQDAKCSLLTTSADIHAEVYNLHTSVLLNVSPFVLNVVTEYIEDSIRDGGASVRDLVARNRAAARAALDGPVLVLQDAVVETSVAWFRITPPGLTATRLHAVLLDSDVYVLPGTYFHWADRQAGERYLRIALARDPEMFDEAMRAARQALERA